MEYEETIERLNAFVRGVALPQHIEAVTIPNDDGTFDVYINTNLSASKQNKALEHELQHIEKDHFYKTAPIRAIESEADGLVLAM